MVRMVELERKYYYPQLGVTCFAWRDINAWDTLPHGKTEATTMIRHYFDGLDGLRCRQHLKEAYISLSWDTVTCPQCLAAKRPEEPFEVFIDTKGD